MKQISFIFLINLISIMALSQTKVSIGMTLEEVKKICPNTTSETYQDQITLSKPDTLYGLIDNWGYRFENGKLNWIFFMKYIDQTNKKNFNKCLVATEKIIKEYTKYYGKPDSTVAGKKTFDENYYSSSLNVLEAYWKNYNNMKIKVSFHIMAGKSLRTFLVSVNYFDKDYPYYN